VTLNRLQARILIASAALFIAMGLFPPWTYTFDYQSAHSEKPAGYSMIIVPPASEEDSPLYGVHLDMPRLMVQWLVLSVATAGAVLVAKYPLTR
jgi:hypothetical protein